VSIVYLLVVLGLGVLVAAVAALFWAVDSGQFDDLESQGRQALDDDGVTTGPAISRRPGPDRPVS
jgi:cbb3-type cytochrome oxidase maturation protein